jgi:hypothetical protein
MKAKKLPSIRLVFPILFFVIGFVSNISSQTTLVSWNFDDEDRVADDGITANLSKTILREDPFSGAYSFYLGAGGGKSLSTMGWTEGADSKYWMIEFSTIGYGSLTLSSKQYSSNQAPRDFKVQYSIDNCSTWTDVPNSSITVGTDFTTGIISELQLPDECNNQASVFLRWIMTSNTAVAESLDLASGSNSRIDDIVIYSYSEVVTISSEITEDKLFVSVFPNPNNGSFSINTNIINSKLKIFNMLGEMIDSRILNDQEYYRIDLSSHPKGMYFVKIYSKEKIFTEKIIVQ